MKRLNKKGISLPEMMAVIAISGIIAAMLSLFTVQTAKTVATHKANNNIITEVAFLFREIEKEIDDKTLTSANFQSTLTGAIQEIEPGNIVVSLGGHIYPSHHEVKFTSVTYEKDANSSTENYDLYTISVTSSTLDSDSALKDKTFETSFLINKEK